MKKKMLISVVAIMWATVAGAVGDAAMDGLMERLSPGLSKKITVKIEPGSAERFRIDADGRRPRITANNRVSASMGLNWYLKYLVGAPVTWSNPHPSLPSVLPLPAEAVERSTDQTMRYYLNYCTHSYSMPFWDEARWQQEIDWMALHGINAALAATGTDAVWDGTLRRLGYPEEKIDSFIAAPAYQAWWLMNNLEGEGAPMTRDQLRRSKELQQSIVKSMRALDIEPVLPGYSGMVPHDAKAELGIEVADPGVWCGYNRPAFLQPTDEAFARIADAYYAEQKKLYGTSKYYSMDPFHEGGNTKGVDLGAAAAAIERAMERNAPGSVWIVQGWQGNPRAELLDAVEPSSMIVLDLHAETSPQWSARGHRGHPWVWCMLLNFGGNEGLHGKLDYVTEAFAAARRCGNPPMGAGLSMEGIENNEMMYELVMEMPWIQGKTDARRWLSDYARARYGAPSAAIDSAWTLLANSVYGADALNHQQGTTESLFCARPSLRPVNASAWAAAEPYYNGDDVIHAARLFASVADEFGDNPNYVHDLVDITRQAVAEAGRKEMRNIVYAELTADKPMYEAGAKRFLELIEMQDSLLGTLSHFRVGNWIEQARACAATPDLADAMEGDARRLITTWGGRIPSENGRLHDYSNREWQGLLKDFYLPRWQRWFDARLSSWGSGSMPRIDFFAEIEEPWTRQTGGYTSQPSGCPVAMARAVLGNLK